MISFFSSQKNTFCTFKNIKGFSKLSGNDCTRLNLHPLKKIITAVFKYTLHEAKLSKELFKPFTKVNEICSHDDLNEKKVE